MRGNFRWERDTENYRRYCSEIKDPATGKFRVVYFPKTMPDLPKVIPDLIVSDSEHGIQCCERDNDWDGNCAIHSAPGVLRKPPIESPFAAGLRYHEALERHYRHRPEPEYAFDWAPNPSREFVIAGTQTGRFSSVSVEERLLKLAQRVVKLESRQSLLFAFAEKIIKIIRYWNLDERLGKKKVEAIKPGEYDAEIVGVTQRGGRMMEVDLRIHRK